jgi:hypothetical protein
MMVDAPAFVFIQRTVAAHAKHTPQYAAAMSQTFARAVSIVGHPVLVAPAAALALAWHRRGSADLAKLAAVLAAFALLVMAYSAWQVRRGHWQHVDASGQQERRTLYRFLLLVLLAGATLASWRGPAELVWGLLLSALLIAGAMLTTRWCKLSLHMAFAVFAGSLLAPLGMGWALAGGALAAAVAWSRLRLQRHEPRDLLAGAVAGALAGAAFWQRFGGGMD